MNDKDDWLFNLGFRLTMVLAILASIMLSCSLIGLLCWVLWAGATLILGVR